MISQDVRNVDPTFVSVVSKVSEVEFDENKHLTLGA